jgi:hypothetical protein
MQQSLPDPLNAWLGFDLFDGNGRSATNLELSFPIYAVLDEIPVIDGSSIEVHGRAHGHLQSSVVTHWDVSRTHTILETAELKIPRPKKRNVMNTFTVATRMPQQRVHHAVLGAVQQRQALRPRRGDIGQRERVQEGPVGRSPTVGDQVTLEKSRLNVGPLSKGAYGDLFFEQPSWLCRAEPVRLTQWAQ